MLLLFLRSSASSLPARAPSPKLWRRATKAPARAVGAAGGLAQAGVSLRVAR